MRKTKVVMLLMGLGAGVFYASSFSGADKKIKLEMPQTMSADGKLSTPLSPKMPFDVTLPPPADRKTETTVRRAFDLFSWHSFIAICWPHQDNELIGQNGDNNTRWESWKNKDQVFLPKGEDPPSWDSTYQSKMKQLVQTGKTPPDLRDVFQPFLTGPLIDQNGEYARFEIVMNKEMFEYIDSFNLYNIEGQRAFTKAVDFPSGDIGKKTLGAVMVKASWKILGKGDSIFKFHRVWAEVKIDSLTSRGIESRIKKVQVGLVGLHIGTKTSISPQWIWSTFEHVDNVPDFNSKNINNHYSFYNKDSAKKNLNKVPAQPWISGMPNQKPSQIMRLVPIDAGTQQLNDSMHALLRDINDKSVWQYYQLVGTQWPVRPEVSKTGDPFPVFLANASLETYDQGNIHDTKVTMVPNVTSSCINCHNGATTWKGKPSDFTYILKAAKALKK